MKISLSAAEQWYGHHAAPCRVRDLMEISLSAAVGLPQNETGMMVLTAENIIAAHEDQAKAILKRDGYPGTLAKLWSKKEKYLPDLANGKGVSQVYGIFWMLWGFENLRRAIARKDVDGAACCMAYALNWAAKVQVKPMEHFFDMGQDMLRGASLGGKKKKEIDDARHDQWKLDAGKISEKHHSYKPWRIAGILEDAYKDNPTLFKKRGTIYKVIK